MTGSNRGCTLGSVHETENCLYWYVINWGGMGVGGSSPDVSFSEQLSACTVLLFGLCDHLRTCGCLCISLSGSHIITILCVLEVTHLLLFHRCACVCTSLYTYFHFLLPLPVCVHTHVHFVCSHSKYVIFPFLLSLLLSLSQLSFSVHLCL